MNSPISSTKVHSVATSYPSSLATVDRASVPSHESIADVDKRTLYYMLCVAVGTALVCSVDAMVQSTAALCSSSCSAATYRDFGRICAHSL